MSDIGLSIAMLVAGFMFGIIKRDCYMMKLCRSQQERGDYWYDKYMIEVREDWEPLSTDFLDTDTRGE